MNGHFLDPTLVRLGTEVLVVVMGALLLAFLTRPRDIPHERPRRVQFGSARVRTPTDDARATPVVFVETERSVEAWFASPAVPEEPWSPGPADHVWTRSDLDGWREQMEGAVLASLDAAGRRIHIVVAPSCGVTIVERTAHLRASIDDLVASASAGSDVRITDRTTDPPAGPHAGPGGEVRVTCLTLAGDQTPPALEAVAPTCVDGSIRVEVGACLRVPAVDLTIELESAHRTGAGGGHSQARVEVRVLGDIDVRGAALRPKQAALLTYLALHPGTPAEQIQDAVWPDCAGSARKRLHVTASQIRSAAGDRVLPTAIDNHYGTGPALSTDLAHFDSMIDKAWANKPERVANLTAALDLVRGPVFRYGDDVEQSYRWVDLEYWAATVEARVARSAMELADLAREMEDLDRAAWALRRGLCAAPLDAGLVEALLEVLAEAGDVDGIAEVYDAHVACLADADLGAPADSTVQVRRRALESCGVLCG